MTSLVCKQKVSYLKDLSNLGSMATDRLALAQIDVTVLSLQDTRLGISLAFSELFISKNGSKLIKLHVLSAAGFLSVLICLVWF